MVKNGEQQAGSHEAALLRFKELKSQQSLKRRLQAWRNLRWLSRADSINLDESLSAVGLLNVRRWTKRKVLLLVLVVSFLLVLVVLIGILLSDVFRLLPCMKPDSPCFNLALAEFQNICDFTLLPVRLTTTAILPPIFSKLLVRSALINVGIRHSRDIVATTFFEEKDAVTSMLLSSGAQNLTVNTLMHVKNGTGLGSIFSYLLNEVDFQPLIRTIRWHNQVEISTKLKVTVYTPLLFKIPVPIRSTFFLTCAHLPCKDPPCKYICQFGDYPLKDPDSSTPYPYVTRVEKVKLGYDQEGRYTISPQVHVWLSAFKASAAFPTSIVDLYFYNSTKSGANSAFRERSDLHEDHKLFQVTMHGFQLQSIEETDGRPFPLNMDLRMYNDTPGQARTASEFTSRFLHKDPMYLYLAATPVDQSCPSLRQALMTVPPAGLSLNTDFSTKDTSDSSLSGLGAITDVFRVNALDLYSLDSSKLRSFVNITLMLPFALEGDLPNLQMDGFSGENLMGRFKSYPVTLPPVPMASWENDKAYWSRPAMTSKKHMDLQGPPAAGEAAAEKNKLLITGNSGSSSSSFHGVDEATLVIFTEAELSPWGLNRLERIFPNFLTQLEDLDIDLVGSAPEEDNVMQAFLHGVRIKLDSLEDNLVHRDKSKAQSKIFETPDGSPIKPRVHFEVKPITYEHSQDSGVIAYVNFTYPDAFQGRFDIRGGSMHFLLADDKENNLGTVTVLDSILSKEMTHVEVEVFIANIEQAKAVRDVIDGYVTEHPSGVRLIDGVVDTSMLLKQQVPIAGDVLEKYCAEDLKNFCSDSAVTDARSCLNSQIGSRALSHECLKILLPRGSLDMEIPDLAKVGLVPTSLPAYIPLVDIGRGIATGLIEEMKSSAAKVAVNLVEVLSLHTPASALDLQLILGPDKLKAPAGTQVEVRARTNLSIGLLDIIDFTYVTPPISMAISAPLSSKEGEQEVLTHLFTLGVPAMDKEQLEGPLLIDSTVHIDNIYHASLWLENVVSDVKDKYVQVQPVSVGDVWSYILEPLRLKIDVLTAINSTASKADGQFVQSGNAAQENSNETWSKIFFRAVSNPNDIVTQTQLAFSHPWNEAIDVRVPPVSNMSVYMNFVQKGDSKLPLLSDGAMCENDPLNCHLAYFKTETFRTKRGKDVAVDTNLNMTATDDGRFWGRLLSDYISGARIGLLLKTDQPNNNQDKSALMDNNFFDIDASIILPNLPPLNIPLKDYVTKVEKTARHLLSTQRRLSLSEIWASLDPIILTATKPVSIKVDTVKICNLESQPIDPLDMWSLTFGTDMVVKTLITIPETLQLDLDVPPIGINVLSGTLSDLLVRFSNGADLNKQTSDIGQPWAATELSTFLYNSKFGNTSTIDLHLDVLKLDKALDVAKNIMGGDKNMSLILAGTHENKSDSLFSRVVSHMMIQLDILSPLKSKDIDKPHEKPNQSFHVKTKFISSPTSLSIISDVFSPKHATPLITTILVGAMNLKLYSEDNPTKPIGQLIVDPVSVSQEADMNIVFKFVIDENGLQGFLGLLERLRSRIPTEVILEGTIDNVDQPSNGGHIRTSLQITKEVMEKYRIFEDRNSFIRFNVDDLLHNTHSTFQVDDVGIIGGEDVGSPVTLPCLLKGFCDGPLGHPHSTPGSDISLKTLVQATVKKLSSFLGLSDNSIDLDVDLPSLSFLMSVDPVSSSPMGMVVTEPMSAHISDDSSLSLAADVKIWDQQAFQATAFRLWEDPFTVKLVGDGRNQDMLMKILSLLPIAIDVSAPSTQEAKIHSLRTLPTVCDGRWNIVKTSATGFTAKVDLPPLTAPVPLTFSGFTASVYYRNSAILRATTADGQFKIAHEGSTKELYVSTVPGTEQPDMGCPYRTAHPALCLVGEALGKLMTFGDSGPFVGELVVTFQNSLAKGMTQMIRMPIQLYSDDGLSSMWGMEDLLPHMKGQPRRTREIRCAAASELVQDIYINVGDTLEQSFRFWEKVEVAMKVYMVNILAFPLDISHLRLTMFFRDPDGVAEDRHSLKTYGPSADYCLLYDVDLPTPGLVIEPGKGGWTPLLYPRMDEARLFESLSRLFDEIIVHGRLCADILNSVIGVSIRSPNKEDAPFLIDLPVSIRSIPFYSPDACMMKNMSGEENKEDKIGKRQEVSVEVDGETISDHQQ